MALRGQGDGYCQHLRGKKKKKDRPVSGEQYYSTLLARTMASLKSPGAFALQTAASPYVVAESASVLVQ